MNKLQKPAGMEIKLFRLGARGWFYTLGATNTGKNPTRCNLRETIEKNSELTGFTTLEECLKDLCQAVENASELLNV